MAESDKGSFWKSGMFAKAYQDEFICFQSEEMRRRLSKQKDGLIM